MKRIKLNIGERIVSSALFPERLSRDGMKLCFKFLDLCQVTEKDRKKVNFRPLETNPNMAVWDEEKDKGKEIILEDAEYQLLTGLISKRQDFPRDMRLAQLLDTIEGAEDYDPNKGQSKE